MHMWTIILSLTHSKVSEGVPTCLPIIHWHIVSNILQDLGTLSPSIISSYQLNPKLIVLLVIHN